MNYDFLIVGGGLAGCSLAYELRLKGASVAIVEKRKVGGGTSAVNQGGVRQQFSQPHNVIAGIETVRRVKQIPEEFGVDPNFRQAGYLLLLSTEESVNAYQAAVNMQVRLGVPTSLIDPAEARRIVPRLDTTGLLVASFCATDGYVDPHLLMKAYANGSKRSGVEVLEDTDVIGFSLNGSQVSEVNTTRGRFGVRAVVNAAGPWASSIARLMGDVLPVHAHQSSTYFLKPAHDDYARIPLTIDIDRRVTVCPHSLGVMVGNPRKPEVPHPGEVASCEWADLPQVRRRAARLLPDLKDAPVVKGWAGYWEVTPDDDPLIGRTKLENAFAFAGFSGHGISIIPGLAPSVAQLLMGEKPVIDLAPFEPSRFASGMPNHTEIWGGTAVAMAEAEASDT